MKLFIWDDTDEGGGPLGCSCLHVVAETLDDAKKIAETAPYFTVDDPDRKKWGDCDF